MKIALEQRAKHPDYRQSNWQSCLPFVENSRGVLLHRIREGCTYNLHKTGPHIGMSFWCGMHASGGKNFSFHAQPPEGKILCERCEEAATKAGLPSAESLAGRHVHVGRTRAVITCCDEAAERSE